MNRTRTVETGRDRIALAHDAGMGRISGVSILSGVLVAYGAFAVLMAIAAAVANAIGVDTDLTTSDWRRLGTSGGLVVAAVLLVCWLFGGYVAGRMARRAGALNGFFTFLLGIVVIAAVAAIASASSDASTIRENLRSVGLPTTGEEWKDIFTVAGIASLVAMLVGSVLGGKMGERWHAKLLGRAVDPDVGPEANARRAADDRQVTANEYHEESIERVERTRAGRIVPDNDRVVSADDDVVVRREVDLRDDAVTTRDADTDADALDNLPGSNGTTRSR